MIAIRSRRSETLASKRRDHETNGPQPGDQDHISVAAVLIGVRLSYVVKAAMDASTEATCALEPYLPTFSRGGEKERFSDIHVD